MYARVTIYEHVETPQIRVPNTFNQLKKDKTGYIDRTIGVQRRNVGHNDTRPTSTVGKLAGSPFIIG